MSAYATGPANPSAVLLKKSDCPPLSATDPEILVTTDIFKYFDAVKNASSAHPMTGVVVVTAEEYPDPVVGNPADRPCAPQVWVTLRNTQVLQTWSQTSFTPAFAQGVFTNDPIPTTSAVFDIDLTMTLPIGEIWQYKMRVRSSDGAIGLVSQREVGFAYPVTGCDSVIGLSPSCPGAGHWHRGCCASQYIICGAIQSIPFIGPLLCPNCRIRCLDNCLNCVNNPCHSCDPCGLSWFLCRFVPGASC